MKSINMLERFNEEIKRRTRVVRVFPNEACLRLGRALTVEQHERWQEDHCCPGEAIGRLTIGGLRVNLDHAHVRPPGLSHSIIMSVVRPRVDRRLGIDVTAIKRVTHPLAPCTSRAKQNVA